MWLIHNPNCSKSCNAIAALISEGIKFQLIDLSQAQLTDQFIMDLISKYTGPYIELIRMNDLEYIKLFGERQISEEELIGALTKMPLLMQRPIIFDESKAIILRPYDKIEEFLNKKS